jgi:hypothetical protein
MAIPGLLRVIAYPALTVDRAIAFLLADPPVDGGKYEKIKMLNRSPIPN